MAWCAVGVGPCSAQVADSLALLAPNGGGSYAPGDSILLAWENTPGVSQIAVTFQASPGGDAQEIASFSISGNSGSQFIAAPQVNSHLCQIRITSMDNPLVFDYSDSTFSIIGCSLLADLLSPRSKLAWGLTLLWSTPLSTKRLILNGGWMASSTRHLPKALAWMH
jgi:hypothetical protein